MYTCLAVDKDTPPAEAPAEPKDLRQPGHKLCLSGPQWAVPIGVGPGFSHVTPTLQWQTEALGTVATDRRVQVLLVYPYPLVQV